MRPAGLNSTRLHKVARCVYTKSMLQEDPLHERSFKLLQERIPWLILGLIGALAGASLVKTFEQVLQKDLTIAFFIPAVVYMASAVGVQTETIFIRGLSQINFSKRKYISKELIVGGLVGALTGLVAFTLISLWFSNTTTAFVVSISMFFSIITSALVSTLIPLLFVRFKIDPALGSGPFGTVIQDLLSLFIYFQVASFVL